MINIFQKNASYNLRSKFFIRAKHDLIVAKRLLNLKSWHDFRYQSVGSFASSN